MILGVIVTYNPDLNTLFDNVSRISSQVDKLVIFDNASINKDEMKGNEKLNSADFMFSATNVGLGAAYNRVIEMYRNNYDFLITFDQDTTIGPDLVSNLLTLFDDPNVAIVGPNFDSRQRNELAVSEVTVLIQSSAVFRMKIFEEIGGFEESYFIDSVDFELCLRAGTFGYRVLRSNNDNIVHNLGFRRKSLFWSYISHSPLRNYYIARNHVRLSRDYFRRYPIFIFKKNFFFLLHFIKLLLLERRFESLKNFYKGFINGCQFKQG
jgi:rhamnosyltransferase